MRNYDAWLEAPYQRRYAQEPPPEVEDLMGVELEWDGRPAVVDSWETWSDADEDGAYGGVDLVLRFTDERGGEENVRPDVLEDVLAGAPAPKPPPFVPTPDVPITIADFETPGVDDEEKPF
jgi:hypothetical protein